MEYFVKPELKDYGSSGKVKYLSRINYTVSLVVCGNGPLLSDLPGGSSFFDEVIHLLRNTVTEIIQQNFYPSN